MLDHRPGKLQPLRPPPEDDRANIQKRGCGAAAIALPVLENVEFALGETKSHLLQEARF